MSAELATVGTPASASGDPGNAPTPRLLKPALDRGDQVFRGVARSIGLFVLVMTAAIGLFLGYQAIPTLRHYGLSFLTETRWLPNSDTIGIASVLLGTVEVALVALVVGFPIALLTATYISEYAPLRLKSTFVALIDLMSAVPSVIWGVWAALWLQPRLIYVSRWLHQYLGWIPIFDVNTDANAAAWAKIQYFGSAFCAGVIVGIMIVPMACSVMRGVFDLAPLGEREGAYALGATKWGMIRTVVLPFGRGGIIGGTMLALGRALGETVAVLLVISTNFKPKIQILAQGTETISALIASLFGEATSRQLAALLTAGFVLFLMTLSVNTVAALFVARSRSGAGVDV
ncbi:MAG TPA: phosphate ABC transporter permease subunit PstC [Jatrophihabitans sp.]|jgi:phosphate transport system permease protein